MASRRPFSGARGAGLLAVGALAACFTLLAPSETSAEPAACLSASPSAWPAASRPYFMVIVDTSGSMTTSVTGTNSCGYPANRIGHARCAVRNTLNAFGGQVNFGLASYAWRNSCAQNPTVTCPNNANCTVQYPTGNNNNCGPWISEPTIAGGTNVHSGGHIIIPMLQDHYWLSPPDPSNISSLLGLVDNTCGVSNGTDNGAGAWNSELGASSNTPLGGVLFDMNRYFSGTYVDKWSAATLSSPIGTLAQGERGCRSINVVLITDGDETCDNTSPTPIAGGCRNGSGAYLNSAGEQLASYEADRMWTTGVASGGQTWHIKTHVIGFAGAVTAALDHIAACGGTGTSYSTANEADLSSALANIVSGAIKPESCDNTDNNCNGCTDEGFSHYCNTNPTCCAWATDAARTTCLTTYKASITPGNPQGNLALLPCTTATNQTEPTHWLCYDPKETCDNNDNNCNGTADEGFTKCGSPLACPVAETCNGQDDDCDGIVDNAAGNSNPYSLAGCVPCTPSAETCDGCDNNCNSIADDGVASITCGIAAGPGVPNWCQGTQTCKAQAAVASKNACEAGGPGNFWNACAYANGGPRAETCNSLDDDCNGIVDDGIAAAACDVPGMPGLSYGGTSQCKRGLQPCGGTCSGYTGPSAEVCDGIDNDCDGIVDNGTLPGVGNACGNSNPPCTKGTTACVGGALVCQGGVQPQTETCNGIDDNCNGVIDDQLSDAPAGVLKNCWAAAGNTCTYLSAHWSPPAGATCTGAGTLTSPCSVGQLACVAGAWACQGGQVPQTEVCNAVDDNCNGQTDESNVPALGSACGSSIGTCKLGATVCTAGVVQCSGATGPVAETCDGKDNDCNGVVDDGTLPGAGVACAMPYDTTAYPGTRTAGECRSGVTACTAGAMGCIGGVAPSPEVCDGKDNDCDGLVDEAGAAPNGIDGTADPVNPAQHVGGACGSAVGACVPGTLTCTSGSVVCVGAKGPTPEICDGKDNDCNGSTDDGTLPGVGAQCGTSTPPCQKGTTACVAGALACQGGVQPKPETCNGIDDNCDGIVDNQLSDAPPTPACWSNAGTACTFLTVKWSPPAGATCTGLGTLTSPCATGTLGCVAGAWKCQGGQTPGTEICNGIDDNCNGQTDESNVPALGSSCGSSVGACKVGATACVAGAVQCQGGTTPQPETCNGIDDDCNGVIDDGAVAGMGVACTMAYDAALYPGTRTSGECKQGVLTCVSGAPACVGGVAPSPELCDGKDNDCDGAFDEAGAPPNGIDGTVDPSNPAQHVGGSCGSSVGACVLGTLTCTNGAVGCVGSKGPTPEICDGLDNDCNGKTDDGTLAGVGNTCGNSTPPCTKGTTACVGGALACQGGVQPQPETCNGVDDNCDGIIDNQLSDVPAVPNCWGVAGNACSYAGAHWSPPAGATCAGLGTLTTPCATGLLACVQGGWKCQGGQVPATEMCNGTDDDCNGQVDEANVPALGSSCGSNVGACKPGTTACVAGGIQCNGGATPKPETCNGIDDDCNGLVDDGAVAGMGVACPMAYDTALYPGTRTGGECKQGVLSCVAGAPACVGGVAPSPEVCDGKDNDCDGAFDEAGAPPNGIDGTVDPSNPAQHVGASCGSTVGACVAGTLTCANGAVGCVGSKGPTPEICDGLDNDCNGKTDDGTLAGVGNTCGNSTPPCTKGTTSCVGGALVCQGGVQPQPETCNGVDDNCDGVVDNQLADVPPVPNCWGLAGNTCSYGGAHWSPPAGATCVGLGTLTTPCGTGLLACVQGGWKCQGGQVPSIEMCNGKDDDCNGQVDESNVPALGSTCGSSTGECKPGTTACVSGGLQCAGGVNPSAEQCDGKDNDCNGQVDDGALPGIGTTCAMAYDKALFPGPRLSGECKAGATVCVAGAIGCAGGVGPSIELCDGKDNDCDGAFDEVGAAPDGIDGSVNPLSSAQHIGDVCGSSVGACVPGALGCTNGAVLCVGAKGPTIEICNGLDDDCNGQTDDGTLAGVGNICGTSTPPCTKGTSQCVGGALVCTGGVQPGIESCNGIDDDCNGVIDDNLTDNPPNGACWTIAGTQCSYKQAQWSPPPGAGCTDVGALTSPCHVGALGCVQGAWKCQADAVPAPEVCDGIDNDCNGQIDEGYVPVTCGSSVGTCKTGLTQCAAGQLSCTGGVTPVAEICDGLDNNCNGLVDDGINLNQPCDPPYDTSLYPGVRKFTANGVNGTCKQGTTACGANGTVECVGGSGPQPESCNGKDDDCDGDIDEAGSAPNGVDGTANPADATQHIGDACGSNVGACVEGHFACSNAIFSCVGGKGPQPETCDCEDNDCNGQIDDDPTVGDAGATSPICGTSTPGKTCVKYQGLCQCAQLCGSSEHPCPTGPYECKNVPESLDPAQTGNYCVLSPADVCGNCDTKTVLLTGADGGSGAIECAPGGTTSDGGGQIPVCICKGIQGCHKPCYGVNCATPLLCTDFGAKAGTCVQDNCWNLPCPGSLVCDKGACQTNPCDGVSCPSGQFCKPSADFASHTCEASCAGITCNVGEECHGGVCVATGCAGGCPTDQVCAGGDAGTDGGSGCVPSKCVADSCQVSGGYCDPLTGACGNDPCEGITCPAAQTCAKGECVETVKDAGADGAGGNGGSGGTDGGNGGSAGKAGGGEGGGGHGGASGSGGGAPAAQEHGVFGLATGGGGCACETGPRSTGGGGAAVALAGLALLASRRRRKRPAGATKGGAR